MYKRVDIILEGQNISNIHYSTIKKSNKILELNQIIFIKTIIIL
jgi:hypothetical protein